MPLPVDKNSHAIQTLRAIPETTVHISVSEGAAAGTSLGDSPKILRVAASGACWVAIGSTVTASSTDTSSMFFPAGAEIFYIAAEDTNISFLSVAGAGNILATVTELT